LLGQRDKLRGDLRVCEDVTRIFLELKPEVVNAILEPLSKLRDTARAGGNRLQEMALCALPDMDYLCEVQRNFKPPFGSPPPRKLRMKFSELYKPLSQH
jgi:hypothetical protein